MLQQERVKLLLGPYQMPKCKVGGRFRTDRSAAADLAPPARDGIDR